MSVKIPIQWVFRERFFQVFKVKLSWIGLRGVSLHKSTRVNKLLIIINIQHFLLNLKVCLPLYFPCLYPLSDLVDITYVQQSRRKVV